MEEIIKDLTSGEKNKETTLQLFVDTAANVFEFPELRDPEVRGNLWKTIFELAEISDNAQVLINCFAAIRILSREKESLKNLITQDWFNLFKKHSGIGTIDFNYEGDKELIAVEVQKAMCNLIFNCGAAATMSCENGILEGISERIKLYKDNIVPENVRFFDMKLLFLITALRPGVRNTLKNDLDGINKLIDVLEYELQQVTDKKIALSSKQVDYVGEILKTLFNITVRIDRMEDECENCTKIVLMSRLYLLAPVENKEKKIDLHRNIINLLTNMPTSFMPHLITSIQPDQELPNILKFEDKNMIAIYEILLFAKNIFSDDPVTVSKQNELITPVISVLLKAANSDRQIRKYLRIQILPPLTEVHSRPEHGNTIRNYLCRLLTSPVTQLKYLVAELLFVLCKKNVDRMIKYTGYGNSAGLFMSKGLLGMRKDEGEADYSSDSGSSDTEEYTKYKHGINPVLGCYEEPHANPMENMSEEQKEYEAMKLVELIDKMTKMGTIQPCRIGPDGKAQPIEHVLQLQEGLKAQQVHNNDDSDSD